MTKRYEYLFHSVLWFIQRLIYSVVPIISFYLATNYNYTTKTLLKFCFLAIRADIGNQVGSLVHSTDNIVCGKFICLITIYLAIILTYTPKTLKIFWLLAIILICR